MDAGVLLGAPGQPFHYSPLKLAEYVAAGMPVIAPDFPAISSRLTDGEDALLVEPYDVGALADAFRALAADEELGSRLRAGARATAAAWSWDEQVRRVYDAVQKCGFR
jgi:glycosyltransferase involved in cell wall biosynthesis